MINNRKSSIDKISASPSWIILCNFFKKNLEIKRKKWLEVRSDRTIPRFLKELISREKIVTYIKKFKYKNQWVVHKSLERKSKKKKKNLERIFYHKASFQNESKLITKSTIFYYTQFVPKYKTFFRFYLNIFIRLFSNFFLH